MNISEFILAVYNKCLQVTKTQANCLKFIEAYCLKIFGEFSELKLSDDSDISIIKSAADEKKNILIIANDIKINFANSENSLDQLSPENLPDCPEYVLQIIATNIWVILTELGKRHLFWKSIYEFVGDSEEFYYNNADAMEVVFIKIEQPEMQTCFIKTFPFYNSE